MRLNNVTPSQFAEIFVSALRDGIAQEATAGYRTEDGYTLFIEPDLNRIEARYLHILILEMTLFKDNRTWNRIEFGEGNSSQQQKKVDSIRQLYEQVRIDKKERVINIPDDSLSTRNKEFRKKLGLDIDFGSSM